MRPCGAWRPGTRTHAAVWLDVYERHYRDGLLTDLARPAPAPSPRRPATQVVCCIDVRSEGLRRLEAIGDYETLGLFGMAIQLRALGHPHPRRGPLPRARHPQIRIEERPLPGHERAAQQHLARAGRATAAARTLRPRRRVRRRAPAGSPHGPRGRRDPRRCARACTSGASRSPRARGSWPPISPPPPTPWSSSIVTQRPRTTPARSPPWRPTSPPPGDGSRASEPRPCRAGSTATGAGDKTLHNPVGGIGGLLGGGGDLRTGLPWQSVFDGDDPYHEPIRLLTVVQAPLERITAVIDNDILGRLFAGGWVTLAARAHPAAPWQLRQGDGAWVPW